MSWIERLDAGFVAVVAWALQLAAAEVGWHLGRQRPSVEQPHRFQATAVQNAIVSLMGLLLAFSFSQGAVRYDTRRVLVVEESNAIGTTYLRAGMLPDEEREIVRRLLREYVDARLAYFDAKEPDAVARAVQASDVLLGQLWARVTAPAVEQPGHLSRSLLVESTNRVVDLHAARVAADDARIPPTILSLLTGVAVAALGAVGWCFGLAGGPHRGPVVLLATLVSAILLVIVDLDEPHRGRIREPVETMRHLQRAIAGE